MAGNALPILLLGGAAIMMLGGKKKTGAKDKDEDTGVQKVPFQEVPFEGSGVGPRPRPEGISQFAAPSKPKKRWGYCQGPEGTVAAYDSEGNCVPFWDENSWEYVADFVKKEYEDWDEEICLEGHWEKDPFSGSEEAADWKVPEEFTRFLRHIIPKMRFNIPATELPPTEGSSYYVKVVWRFVGDVIYTEICGWHRVT